MISENQYTEEVYEWIKLTERYFTGYYCFLVNRTVEVGFKNVNHVRAHAWTGATTKPLKGRLDNVTTENLMKKSTYFASITHKSGFTIGFGDELIVNGGQVSDLN